MKVDLDDRQMLFEEKKQLQQDITNWQKVLIYLDENKDKHFTNQIADLMEIYNLTNKNK